MFVSQGIEIEILLNRRTKRLSLILLLLANVQMPKIYICKGELWFSHWLMYIQYPHSTYLINNSWIEQQKIPAFKFSIENCNWIH